MAEKHLKNWSTFLVISKMQIKTTLRFNLTPVRMAKIKNSSDSRCWRRCGERGTLLHCWWDGKLATLEIILDVPQKIGHSSTRRSSNTSYTQKMFCNKDTCSTMFIAALFIIARSWNEPRCPSTEEWIQKMWCSYTMEYYYSAIKNWIYKILGQMDVSGGYHP